MARFLEEEMLAGNVAKQQGPPPCSSPTLPRAPQVSLLDPQPRPGGRHLSPNVKIPGAILTISEKIAFSIENNSSLVPCSACWPPPDRTWSPASFCSGQPAERLQQAHWPPGPVSHFPPGCHLDGSFYYLFFSWVPFFSILMRPQIQLERTNANFLESWKLNFFKKRDRTLEGEHSLFSQRQ